MISRTTFVKDFIENCKKNNIIIDRFVDFSPNLLMQYVIQNQKNIDEIIIIKKK